MATATGAARAVLDPAPPRQQNAAARKPQAKTNEHTLPECRRAEHEYCRPGEVRTPHGDIAIPALRCDCTCHVEAGR